MIKIINLKKRPNDYSLIKFGYSPYKTLIKSEATTSFTTPTKTALSSGPRALTP